MKKPHILFIDDEIIVLNYFKRRFQDYRNKWNMDFANSVDEALSKLEAGRYDVVVSDLKMPGKTGFDLLKIVNGSERTKGLSVILLTGVDESDLKRKALDLGAIDLLSKPVQVDDLTARLNSVLRQKEREFRNLEFSNLQKEQRIRKHKLELVGKMAIGAFHDINNMLTIISGYAQLIQIEPESAEKSMSQIADSCCLASEFTKQILEFAKSSNEDREPCDINRTIDSAVNLTRRCILKDVELSWTMPSRHTSILINQAQIFQLLMDLCLTVSRNMTTKGRITVSLLEVDFSGDRRQDSTPGAIPPGRYVCLIVSDSKAKVGTRMLRKFSVLPPLEQGSTNDIGTDSDAVHLIVEKHNAYLRVARPQRKTVVIVVYFSVH